MTPLEPGVIVFSGIFSKSKVKELFLAPLDNPGEAMNVYFDLTMKIANVSIPNRI